MNLFGLFFIAAGAFSICGSAMDWDFFMESRKAYLLVKLLGRNGARLFYGALGLAIVVLGALMTVGVIAAKAN